MKKNINKIITAILLMLIVGFWHGEAVAQMVDSIARKDIQNLQTSLENTKNLSQIADLLISWTGIVFTIFAVILGAASIYTGVQINEIRKSKEEIKNTLAEAKNNLKEQNQAIENLKVEFEKEKDLHLKLIFPLIEGQYSFQQGEYDKAFQLYNEAKQILPNHPWILKKFHWLLTNTGRFEEAIQNLENYLSKFPEDKEATYYLAVAYRRNNQLEVAEKLIKSLATEIKYPRAVYEYASILLRKNSFKEAEEQFIEATRNYATGEKGTQLFAYLNLSITQRILSKVEFSTKNAEKAKIKIAEELFKTPNNAHIILQLGVAQLMLNEEDSIQTIKSAISKGLPSENAKSAIDKLEKVQSAKASTLILEAITTLKKYYEKK